MEEREGGREERGREGGEREGGRREGGREGGGREERGREMCDEYTVEHLITSELSIKESLSSRSPRT